MKSWMKWIAVPFFLIALLLVAALLVPFLVDLEKFKPQIQSAVAGAVNAELDFKSIRLHAIPKLGVTVKSASVKNSDPAFQGTTLFKTDEMFLATEFWPLLQGKLIGELRIINPAIEMVMEKGSNNLASLAKVDGSSTKEPTTAPAQSPAPGGAPSAPAPVKELRERVVIKSIAITGAAAGVKNNGKALASVKDLDFVVNNIGLDRDISINLSTTVKAKESGAAVQGPLTLSMTTRINSSDSELFKSLDFSGRLDLAGMAINFQNALVKKPGQVIAARIKGTATTKTLDVDDLGFEVLNISGAGKARISDFKSLATALELAIRSPDISSLGAILPQHEKLLQKASLEFSTKVNGPVSDLSAIKAEVDLASKLSGTDINLTVRADSVLPAKMQIKTTSNRMDLAALLKPFMPPKPANPGEEKGAPSNAPGAPQGTVAAPAPGGAAGDEKDFALSPELKETLKPHDIAVDVQMREILYDTLNIKDLTLRAGFRNLEATIQQFSMQTLGGTIKAAGKLELSQDPVQFQGNIDLNGVSSSEAIAVIAPAHKDAIHGILTTSMSVNARGTTRKTLTKTLNASGSFQLKDAEVKGASFRPLVAEAFAGYVGGLTSGKAADKAFKNIEKFLASPLGQKIPADKHPKVDDLRKKLDGVKNVKIPDKYTGEKKLGSTSGKFEINDGKIKITSDVASELGQLKLAATSSLEGQLEGSADVNVSEVEKQKLVAQSEYVALMFDKNKNLQLPFRIGGTLTSPKLTLVTGELTRNFEDNAAARLEQEGKKALDAAAVDARKALEAAARDALKKAAPQLDEAKRKQAEEKAKEAQKKLEADAKDKIKGLFKKK